jgi:ubiquitin conjugation factor E4 B
VPSAKLPLISTELLPFLHDLASVLADDTLRDVLTPTLSLFFQEWYKISPSPDILGRDWRMYLGAISALAQVKGIASSVSQGPAAVSNDAHDSQLPQLAVWMAPNATAARLEWQSLLGPLTRLSVFPREFVRSRSTVNRIHADIG